MDLSQKVPDFWLQVEQCEHEWNPNYYGGEPGCCPNQELGCFGPSEEHCTKCGVFMTDCPCGCCYSWSGWSSARWMKFHGLPFGY